MHDAILHAGLAPNNRFDHGATLPLDWSSAAALAAELFCADFFA
jgi:hypothetical protein